MTEQTWVCRHGCTYTGESVAHNMAAHREEYQQHRATTDRVILSWRPTTKPDSAAWEGAWWWYRISPADIVLSQAAEGHASQVVARTEAARLNGRPFLLEVR